MSNECPCRYCTKETGRSDICHGICERYKTWKKNHDEQVAQERQQRQSDGRRGQVNGIGNRTATGEIKKSVKRRK